MQVTETLADGLRRSYAVRVPADELESRARARLADIGKNLRLPGFRPGKVPANLIRKRYGTSVMAEVLQDAVNGVADQVVSERQLRPAGQPRVSLEGRPDVSAAAAQDLDLKVELELLPDIDVPDLTALKLTRYRAEPSEATIDKALDSVVAQNRKLEDLDPRPAAVGEVLVMDFTGRIDGVAFEGGAATDANIEIGGAGFIPGFTEQLEGLAPGETRTIEVTFPAEYQVADLAGKTAQFEVVAKALKQPVAPARDDALAGTLGFDSFAALHAAVVAQIQLEYDQMARLRIKRELLDALAESADFPAPEGLLDAEFASIWQRVETDLREGRADDEDRGKDEATLKAEYRAIADRRVRLGLLLAEIGRLHQIEVSQAELTQALRTEVARYPGQEQQVLQFFQKTPAAVQQLRGPIFEDKVVDHILSLAQVTDKIVSPEELALPPDDAAVPAAGSVARAAEVPEAAEPIDDEIAGGAPADGGDVAAGGDAADGAG